MVVLLCGYCGHEVGVSESMRDVAIRCARCGRPMTVKAAADPARTEIRPLQLSRIGDSDLSLHAAPAAVPTSHAGDEDTQTPGSAARPLSFAFLSPPREPNEMGWLGHYRILSMLGQGGMGIVFGAVDTNLQRWVALKVMRPESAQDDAARQRFLREARALAALKSEHIVTVHQVGEANKLPFLAMEFLQGEPLDDWLKRRGRPALPEMLRLGIEIGLGLTAAHACGLIHRDIKPANIFLEAVSGDDHHSPGTTHRVKILDFGLARVTDERTNLTDPGRVIGTPGYMAPEQVEGKGVDARSDLFSLGCILYELGTGVHPFAGANALAILMAVLAKEPTPPRELNADLPAPLAALIQQLMAKDPKNRPASARAVVAALEAIGTPEASGNPTPRPDAAPPRWRMLGVALLAGAVIGGAAWLAWWLWTR